MEVLDNLLIDNRISMRKISYDSEVSIGNVHRIIKHHKSHPYKKTLVQEKK